MLMSSGRLVKGRKEMSVFDLFSKRQKRARGEVPDVYSYKELPNPLRVQIVHIIRDAIGQSYGSASPANKAYEFIHGTLCREYGVFKLVEYSNTKEEAVLNFFLQEKSTERALDVIELSFAYIANVIAANVHYEFHTPVKLAPEEAVLELNQRFKEHGIGYQFEAGEILRVDSEFLHSHAVKPTLAVLHDANFKGANEEFLAAHEHYRHQRFKECFVETLKSFESTMKTICHLRKWPIKTGDTAKNLIATCLDKGLIPPYIDSQFSSIRSLLESGVPTLRNKNGGHGQGSTPVDVPEYLARYALNLTATTILFLVEAHQGTK